MIVAGIHRLFGLLGRASQACADAVGDTGGIGDDQGRARIGGSFRERADRLAQIGAHGNLGHIYGAVGHGHGCQVLFGRLLAAGGKFGSGAQRGCLGSLAAGVGVDFRVQHQDIDILSAGQHMVQAAEADVVGPAVAAYDPLYGGSGIPGRL